MKITVKPGAGTIYTVNLKNANGETQGKAVLRPQSLLKPLFVELSKADHSLGVQPNGAVLPDIKKIVAPDPSIQPDDKLKNQSTPPRTPIIQPKQTGCS